MRTILYNLGNVANRLLGMFSLSKDIWIFVLISVQIEGTLSGFRFRIFYVEELYFYIAYSCRIFSYILVCQLDKAQVNVRLQRELISEIDDLIRRGRFSSKTEAFSEALRLLIRTYKGEELARKIDRIREGTEIYPDLAEAVTSSHEEEDERLG